MPEIDQYKQMEVSVPHNQWQRFVTDSINIIQKRLTEIESQTNGAKKGRMDKMEKQIDRLERLYEVMSEWHKPKTYYFPGDAYIFPKKSEKLTTNNSEVTKKSDTIAIDKNLIKSWLAGELHERVFNKVLNLVLEAEDGK